MAEVDISALKDMLCAQQQLLQKLYNELDAEREASSTAASEALSVILRLHGEKAAIKMEAEQYKRLAEEKMSHAEESLAIFEDVIYQKEMEVADLDYQLRACRYKLLSTGSIDPGVGEIKFPENLLQGGNTSLQSIGRRNSMPISLNYSYPKKCTIDREGSTDSILKIEDKNAGEELNEQSSDTEKKTDNSMTGDINSSWEQIRKLDERVKEIAGANYGNFRNETCYPSPLSSQLNSCNPYDSTNLGSKTRSPSSQLSTGNPLDQKRVAIVNETGLTKSPGNSSENGSTVGSPCSLNVHDVFEVPRADQNHETCELQTKDEKKIACLGNEHLAKGDSVHPEAVKLCDKDEPDWLKKLLQSIHHENNLSIIDCHLADRGTTSFSKLNQQNGASEILDTERPAVGQVSTNRMEELKLLNEIKEQINSLHDEIRRSKMKKSSRKEELSLVPLMEDMLYFWL